MVAKLPQELPPCWWPGRSHLQPFCGSGLCPTPGCARDMTDTGAVVCSKTQHAELTFCLESPVTICSHHL